MVVGLGAYPVASKPRCGPRAYRPRGAARCVSPFLEQSETCFKHECVVFVSGGMLITARAMRLLLSSTATRRFAVSIFMAASWRRPCATAPAPGT